jgi:hypothetical protein
VLAGADRRLRRRVLEGTDGDGWSVQAGLRELRVEGVQPVLRLGMQVILPKEDLTAELEALLRPEAVADDDGDGDGDDELAYDVNDSYDSRDLYDIVVDVILHEDLIGWDYLAARVDEVVIASLLAPLGPMLSLLPFRRDVPALAQLALTVLSRLQEDLLSWEEMDVQGYRDHLARTSTWWDRAAAHWRALREVDLHTPFGGGRDVVDASGEMKLDPRNHAPALRSSMADGALDEVLEDLWLVHDQARAMAGALDWLESRGCSPHKDPRSPVYRRAQLERGVRELDRAFPADPAQALREALAAEAWPRAVAVTYLPDGRHVMLRDLDVGGEGRRAPVAEGTREELADLAHDTLQLPPTLEGWACRMTLASGRRPVRIEFLEYDAQWEPVAAAGLVAGDVVRLPGNRYAWQIADVHEGDTPEEVQLQLAAPGLPVFGRDDPVERWAPREPPLSPIKA